jgi:hypothetical protein
MVTAPLSGMAPVAAPSVLEKVLLASTCAAVAFPLAKCAEPVCVPQPVAVSPQKVASLNTCAGVAPLAESAGSRAMISSSVQPVAPGLALGSAKTLRLAPVVPLRSRLHRSCRVYMALADASGAAGASSFEMGVTACAPADSASDRTASPSGRQ